MTKEELERIKQAYNSGLKVQIWFDGYWEDFDARDYSMYGDPFSENRQYRIVGDAYANFAEKRIAELEKENAELKEKVERYYCLLEKSMDCETCKYWDISDNRTEEPCNSCFYDSSKWELKEVSK